MGTTEISILGLASIISWLVVGIRLMNLCNASGVSLGWLSFVPFLNYTRWARLAGKSPWLVLLWIIPIVGVILSFLWLNTISEHTGTKSPWFWVFLIVTVISWGGVAIGGTFSFILSIIGAVLITVALWMIFDPTKPIRANAAA